MATEDITIHLPDDLSHRLERLAGLTGQPLEGLIVRTLTSTLPPLPDDLPASTRDALQALESLSDADLQALAQATLPEEDYERFSELRDMRREGTISAAENDELTRLSQAADLLTLQKAYAAVLLKWRGHRLPPLAASAKADT